MTTRGGKGIPVRTDCTDEAQVAALFGRVEREQDRLDVLANAVWGASDFVTSVNDWQAAMTRPFWEQPTDHWRGMMTAGPYAYFLMSCHAARLMATRGRGLIVGVTDGVMEGGPPDAYGGQLVWDLAHTCINRMLLGMAAEGKKRKIAVVTLMPGFMRTERVVMNLTEELKKAFPFDKSESTEYVGRAVAALAGDPKVLKKSGKIHFVADLAQEYGFVDVDGKYVPRFNPFG